MMSPRQFVFQNQIANLFDLIRFSLAAQGLNIDDFGNTGLGEKVTIGRPRCPLLQALFI
jgi:hypothetical protein